MPHWTPLFPSIIRGGVTEATSYGITFFFEQPTKVTTFWNGDLCVPPGTVVTGVSPAWDGTINGTMKNPVISYVNNSTPATQGHDTRIGGFSAGARQTFPVSLVNGDRLIHVASRSVALGVIPATGGATEKVAVLTCLGSGAAPDMFRPSFYGTGTSVYTFNDIDTGKILSLTNPSGTIPTYGAVTTGQRLNTNHYQFVSPSTYNYTYTETMAAPFYHLSTVSDNSYCFVPDNYYPTYSGGNAGHSKVFGMMAMKCLISHAEQEVSIRKYIQLGIDLEALAQVNGQAWWGGGHGMGKKWPILYKKIMFGENEADVPYYVTGNSGKLKFWEDATTYLDGSTARWGLDSTLTGGYGGYATSNHGARPSAGNVDQISMNYRYLLDGENPNDEYRLAGGYEWFANSSIMQCLAARKMNSYWMTQHPAYFAFMDRWGSGEWPTMHNSWETRYKNEINGSASITNYAPTFNKDANQFRGTGSGWATALWSAFR